MSLRTMADNLTNGNLTEAKRQARRFKLIQIIDFYQHDLGVSYHLAGKTALYLKNHESFAAYCAAEREYQQLINEEN